MKTKALWLFFALFFTFASIWFIGCNSDDGSPSGPGWQNGNDSTAVVTGIVIDSETNTVISGARVGSDDGESAVTNRNGAYSFVLAVGERTITVSADYYEALEHSVSIAGGDSAQSDFALDPSPGIAAGMIMEYGTSEPLAAAQITAGDSTVVSDGEGNYRLTAHHGTYTMSITMDGYEPKEQEILLRAGRTTTTNIYLTRILTEDDYGRIIGRVTDQDNHEGIQGARVRCDDSEATTDASGNYEILVLPGDKVVVAIAGGYETIGRDLHVAAGNAHQLNFPLVSSNTGNQYGVVSGTVSNASNGSGVAGARISVGPEYVLTNGDGQYAMRIMAGVITVIAAADGFISQNQAARIDPDLNTSVHFTLTPTGGGGPDAGTLRGRITNAQNSQPIQGARISCGGASATSDGSGNYTMQVNAGSFNASVSANGFTSQARNVVITANQTTTADFALTTGGGGGGNGSVSGRVTDVTSNRPIGQARIDIGGKFAYTDFSGDYIVRDLGSGNYTIAASADGYHDISENIPIIADQNVVVNFAMQPGGGGGDGQAQINGYVKNQQGAAINGATVRSDDGAVATTNGSGWYEFLVTSGARSITASAGGYQSQTQNRNTETNRSYRIDFNLAR